MPTATKTPAKKQTRASATAQQNAPRDFGPVFIVAVVVVLNVIGLVMVLSASSVESLREYGSSWFFFERQIAWVAAGAGMFIIGVRFDHRRLRAIAVPLLLVAVSLLLLVLVPGLGVTVYGSRRWLGSGAVRFQPSELAKLALAVFIAHLLTRHAELKRAEFSPYPALVALGVVIALVMGEPDMGTALVMALMVGAMLFIAGAPLKTMATIGGGGAALAFLIGIVAPYRRARLMSFMHPFSDHSNSGYQVVQSLVGVASGGLFGVGLGASRAKWGFLPNAHTDFIFAIIGEELGLLGTLLVVGLFAALTFLGVRTAIRSNDMFSKLLAAGITTWIAGQAVVNIGAVIGLLPVTGVPLPFVSFGGSALLFSMCATGVLVNIASRNRPVTR
jgi:cell division protein FtsW